MDRTWVTGSSLQGYRPGGKRGGLAVRQRGAVVHAIHYCAGTDMTWDRFGDRCWAGLQEQNARNVAVHGKVCRVLKALHDRMLVVIVMVNNRRKGGP